MAESGVVRGVSQQIPVVADVESTQGHKGLPLGEFIYIQENLFRSIHAAFSPAMNGVLLSRFRSRIIKIAALLVGDFHIGFLDPAQHFFVKLLLQRFGRLHHRVGVNIFGLQIRFHVGIFLITQPVVVVHQLAAIDLSNFGLFLRDRRRGERRRRVGCGKD